MRVNIVTTIIDALRRFGSPTQKTALRRQDEFVEGKRVIERRRYVARSELGTSPTFVATIEPVPETMVALSDEELAPILENATLVDRFITAFPSSARGDQFLDLLDGAFGVWSEATKKKGYTNEAVIEIVGAAFGKFCVETLDMRWIRITDGDGTAIAVQGRAKDFRGFPFHTISKRIPLGEYGFFKPVYISLQDAARRDWKPINQSDQQR